MLENWPISVMNQIKRHEKCELDDGNVTQGESLKYANLYIWI